MIKDNQSIKKILAIILGLVFAAAAWAQTWGADVRLSDGSYEAWPAGNNAKYAAVSSDTVYAIWADGNGFWSGVSCKCSIDNGNTWHRYYILSENNSFSSSPAIAVSKGVAHAVWSDEIDGSREIYYRRFEDDYLGPVVRLTYEDSSCSSPSIAVSDSVVHVVWGRSRGDWDADICYRCFDGASWRPAVVLCSDTLPMTWGASVASSAKDVHMVWESGNALHYRHSPDDGQTWDEDTIIVEGPWWVDEPCAASWEKELHVVWVDDRVHDWGDIFYKKFDGSGWGADTPLTDSEDEKFYPSVAVWDNNVHVAWSQSYASYEVAYKRFDGTSWGPDTLLTPDDWADSRFPSIAAQGNDIHLVWMDYRNDINEMFYKHGTLGGGGVLDSALTEGRMSLDVFCGAGFAFVKYSLPFGQSGSISIYDASGRKVESMKAQGSGEVRLSPHSSGVYFVRLETKDYIAAKKIVLLK